MFDIQESGGVFDSWIDRWRAFRGIDQWPIVNGEVVNTEYINSGESGYYKLTLKYRAPGLEAEVLPITSIVVLDSDRGAKIGEIIRLRAHPSKPMKAVFENTSQAAGHLMGWVIFFAFASVLLVIKACNAFFADTR